MCLHLSQTLAGPWVPCRGIKTLEQDAWERECCLAAKLGEHTQVSWYDMREDLEAWFHVLSKEGNSNGRKFVGTWTPHLETEMPNLVEYHPHCFEIWFWVPGFDALAASVIALFDRCDQHLTYMLIKRYHWIHGAPTSFGDIHTAIWDCQHKGWVAHTQLWPQHISDHGNCVSHSGTKWTAVLWDGPFQTLVLQKQASTTVLFIRIWPMHQWEWGGSANHVISIESTIFSWRKQSFFWNLTSGEH